MSNKRTQVKAELMLLFSAAIWAGTFVIIKYVLEEVSPFYFLAIRFGFAALVFLLLTSKHLHNTSAAEIKGGIVLGLLLFLGFASQTIGLQYTTASNSALITGVNILIVPFAQYFILKKMVLFENWVGVISATAGLVLLTKPLEHGINAGDLITLICAFSWGFYIIFIDVYTRKFNIYVLVFVQFLLVGALSFTLALIFESRADIKFTVDGLLFIAYTSVLATLGATFLCNKYQKETTPVRAALILTFEQPGAVVLALIFLKEYFSTLQIIGGLLMILGILFSETFEYFRVRFNFARNV
jgi:drug/metabolite transporter (DMT)-like permease